MAKEAKTAAKQHRMNRPPPIPVAIPEADLVLDVNTARPSKEEIAKAIKKQKNGKAPGPDVISAENLKGDVITSTQMLYQIYAKVWEEERKEDHLVKIPKKGTWQTVTTTEELPCYQFQEKSSVESSCKD